MAAAAAGAAGARARGVEPEDFGDPRGIAADLRGAAGARGTAGGGRERVAATGGAADAGFGAAGHTSPFSLQPRYRNASGLLTYSRVCLNSGLPPDRIGATGAPTRCKTAVIIGSHPLAPVWLASLLDVAPLEFLLFPRRKRTALRSLSITWLADCNRREERLTDRLHVRSGRSAPSAGAGVPRAYLEPPWKCAIFNAQNCAIFDAH